MQYDLSKLETVLISAKNLSEQIIKFKKKKDSGEYRLISGLLTYNLNILKTIGAYHGREDIQTRQKESMDSVIELICVLQYKADASEPTESKMPGKVQTFCEGHTI